MAKETSASRACPASFSRLRCRPTRWEMETHVKTSAYVSGELRQIDGAFDGRTQGSHNQDGHHLSTGDACREGGNPRPALCAHRVAPRSCEGAASTSR